MRMKVLTMAGLVSAVSVLPVSAAVIDSASSGIALPTTTIGFEEVALGNGAVTNEFAAFGITFSPNVSYFNSVSPRPNFSGPAVITFFGTAVSIKFTNVVSDASAVMSANFGSAMFSSFLKGTVVETFSSTLDLSANNFYGFSNSLFDEIRIDPAGSTSVAMDNLAYSVAAVPVPASLPLLVGALGGAVLMRRRKRARS